MSHLNSGKNKTPACGECRTGVLSFCLCLAARLGMNHTKFIAKCNKFIKTLQNAILPRLLHCKMQPSRLARCANSFARLWQIIKKAAQIHAVLRRRKLNTVSDTLRGRGEPARRRIVGDNRVFVPLIPKGLGVIRQRCPNASI